MTYVSWLILQYSGALNSFRHDTFKRTMIDNVATNMREKKNVQRRKKASFPHLYIFIPIFYNHTPNLRQLTFSFTTFYR